MEERKEFESAGANQGVRRFVLPPPVEPDSVSDIEADEIADLQKSERRRPVGGRRGSAIVAVGALVMVAFALTKFYMQGAGILYANESHTLQGCAVGKVIEYVPRRFAGGITMSMSVPAYYIVLMPDGRQLMIDPAPGLSRQYRGEVAVDTELGSLTGHIRHIIDAKGCDVSR